MKTIIINASPRKNWNTAQLLKEAEKGAQAAGAETEYIDLYDLNFTGCRSCLVCKLTDGKHPGCFWKDDLSPLIDRIFNADALIIGTPIYYGEPTAQFRAFIERLAFCAMPYQQGTYFNGRLNTAVIYTMNASQEYYDNLRPYLSRIEHLFIRTLHGEVSSYAAVDTMQVNDYSIYDMALFNEEHKKQRHAEHFPKDKEACYRLGMDICR